MQKTLFLSAENQRNENRHREIDEPEKQGIIERFAAFVLTVFLVFSERLCVFVRAAFEYIARDVEIAETRESEQYSHKYKYKTYDKQGIREDHKLICR